MDEGNSKEVGLIEITDEDSMPSTSSSETRPLIVLLESMVFSDTPVPPAQFLLVLEKEFNMDIKTLNAHEIKTYIDTIKTDLKKWPKWDLVEQKINKLKKKKDLSQIKQIIEHNYRLLKEYLGAKIEKTKLHLIINQLKTEDLIGPLTLEMNGETIFEVFGIRNQLNSLIYNRQNPVEINTVIKIIYFEDRRPIAAALPYYTLSSLLHWFDVRLSIDLPFFKFSRDTSHTTTKTLVNDSNGIQRNPKKELDPDIYRKTTSSTSRAYKVSGVTNLLNKILKHYSNKPEYDMLKHIFNVIKYDMQIDSNTIEVPGSYKRHLNKYPYVRKLFPKGDLDEPFLHNVYVEVMVSPIQGWHIEKLINVKRPVLPDLQSWLKIECMQCKQEFKGVKFLMNLQEHLKTYHFDDPDWTCTNCEKVFSMAEITDEGWCHDC